MNTFLYCLLGWYICAGLFIRLVPQFREVVWYKADGKLRDDEPQLYVFAFWLSSPVVYSVCLVYYCLLLPVAWQLGALLAGNPPPPPTKKKSTGSKVTVARLDENGELQVTSRELNQ